MWKITLCFTSCLYLDSITNNDASKINQPLIFSHIRASPSSYHERTENTTRMNVKVKEWFACIGMESVTFDKLIAKSWMYCKQNSVLSSRPCWRSLTHTSILTQQSVTEKHTEIHPVLPNMRILRIILENTCSSFELDMTHNISCQTLFECNFWARFYLIQAL